MSKPHVVVFPSGYPTLHAPVSGIFFLEQVQALQHNGVDMGVVYPDLRSLRTLSPSALLENRFQVTKRIEEGVQTVRCAGWNVPNTKLRMHLHVVLYRWLLKKYIEAYGRPDLIHAHSALWAGHAARVVSEEMDIPLVITEHSTGFARDLYAPWEKQIICRVFHRAASVIAVSEALAKELKPYAPADRLCVIPNMVNTDQFGLPPSPRSSSPFTFLNVALLTPKKGIDVLLHAFAQSFEGEPDVQLDIGGDGPQRAELEDLARRLGIGSQVRFLGRLSRDEVRDRMWKANCFVLSSHVETFGVVVIEAMATGLPVVATSAGGPEEIITDRAGVIVEPDNVDALAAAMHETYRSGSGMEEDKIRTIVKKGYSRLAVSERIKSMYERILSSQVR